MQASSNSCEGTEAFDATILIDVISCNFSFDRAAPSDKPSEAVRKTLIVDMQSHQPHSMPDLVKKRRSAFDTTPPPFLPPRKPTFNKPRQPVTTLGTASPRTTSPTSSLGRPSSLPSIPDTEPADERLNEFPGSIGQARGVAQQQTDEPNVRSFPRNQRLQALRNEQPPVIYPRPVPMALRRSSSLRIHREVSDDDDVLLTVHPSLLTSPQSAPCLRSMEPRPHSHPPLRPQFPLGADDHDKSDPWHPSPLPPPSPTARLLQPRPRASFVRLSSLDHILSYRDDKAQWKRDSQLHVELTDPEKQAIDDIDYDPVPADEDRKSEASDDTIVPAHPNDHSLGSLKQRNKFRNFAAEAGFCFTIAATQFLGEYLISGFAVALPALFNRTFDESNALAIGAGELGSFWPATLLPLILSATLLTFARLADIYGGYYLYMAGLIWLGIWTLIPGFCTSLIILDVSRAMQGLAIAAFMPSTFVMVSSFYETGPRKNFVLGLYCGCAPLGFYAGFLTAGALPDEQVAWYLWVASIVAFLAALAAYLTVPHDRTDRKQLGLKMDWLGAFLITAGLLLVCYALAYVPGAALSTLLAKTSFGLPIVYGPFSAGMACLIAAFWVEGWYAECPLLPFEFFRPKSTMAICFAALCFYASYGVWLYESAAYFGLPGITKYAKGVEGITLAIWYTPTAVGGLILCVVGSTLLNFVRMEYLLLVSGLAWVIAPLLLAVCPTPIHYWAVVVPSMLCATLGIDMTYTISLVHFAATQPRKYQGLCGAICSILVNLGIAFSLPLSQIIQQKASWLYSNAHCNFDPWSTEQRTCLDKETQVSYSAMFLYAAASAGLGLVVCIIFVRFPRPAAKQKLVDEERPREASSESPTLVEPVEGEEVDGTSEVQRARD
ncbi:hypothetical protein LTR56_019666 [Elasticomyces elasticus]|nr:hypothetical protein LTR56_019666 [Elasticomyces elasticus]KAK3662357.1 hypothetical protein LTR22_006890 [Elasticomyces elasticus]KAK4924704.1 hypothetical protein LTR49_008153 [Elasticomyces elasticus]KAK5766890.1 hypothetical protein LTS12_002966 [Elasticomyces elasticus]